MADRPTFELESPMSQLAPTALAILKAARRLLTRKGFGALSLENIAVEAHVPKSLIRYHFGSKAGLVEVLVESLIHDANLALRNEVSKNLEGVKRAHVAIQSQQVMSADRRSFQIFYEILPHVVRERSLRRRGAALYDWYRAIDMWALEAANEDLDADDIAAFAALTIAVCDGLAVQLLLDPDRFDHAGAYRLWKELVRMFLRERSAPADPGSAFPMQGGSHGDPVERR